MLIRWDRIRQIADDIDNEEQLKLRFNMGEWGTSTATCGTVACVAGFALHRFDPKTWQEVLHGAWTDVGKEAARHFGLGRCNEQELFMAEGSNLSFHAMTADPKHVARSLRWMTDHKVINWRRAWEATADAGAPAWMLVTDFEDDR